MLIRAKAKSVFQLDSRHVCCESRRKELEGYELMHSGVLILNTSISTILEWDCVFCGQHHKWKGLLEKGKNTYVAVEFVDIDELPVGA